MLGKEQLRMMKPTAMLVNCARGGIVDEEALYEALEQGVLAGAAIDVFSKEPPGENVLLKSDKVITTPHLAASTAEAEKSAGLDIAEQVVDVLKGLPAKSPINTPLISPEVMATVGPYVTVGTIIARIAVQLMEGQLKSISLLYQGEIAEEDTKPIRTSVLAGLLESQSEERVNMVNADMIASSRGLKVLEQRESTIENYANLVSVTLETTAGSTTVAGSSIRERPHLIKVNDFWLEIEPKGSYMLFTEHKDRPGMIGALGTILGKNNINVSQMQVSRGVKRGGSAMMVLCLDDPISPECHQQILSIPDMDRVWVVKLD
jgi:D-3-phosphoglycerate dehydrogenase